MRIARAAVLSVLIAGSALVGTAAAPHAQAMACPDPDYPCDPRPTPLPGPIGKPSVTFGCGTVTISEAGRSVTLPILPCPGPVIF